MRKEEIARYTVWLAGTACLVVLSSVRAESDEQRLTLLDAVHHALASYPSIAASVASRDAVGAAVREAEANKLPVVALGAAATRYQKPMVVHPIHSFTPTQIPPFDRTLFQVLGQVSYTLFDGGARSSRIEGRKAEEEAADELVDGTGQNLSMLVIGDYLEALGLAKSLEAHDRAIGALESELSRVTQLFDVGRAAQIEILRVEAAIASAEAERVGVASSLDRAERSLARLTGLEVAQTRAGRLVAVSISESVLPPREELRQQALAESPAAQAARRRLDAAEATVHGAQSARFPDVGVGGSYINYGSASGVNQLEWNVGVQVSYPLFTGGAVSSAIARAQANQRRATEDVRLAEAEVEEGLDSALSAIEEASARVRSLTTAARRFEEVVRIEQLRLDAGAGTQTDYLRSEADLLSARAALIRAEYVAIFAWTGLARATGQLTPTWISDSVRNAR